MLVPEGWNRYYGGQINVGGFVYDVSVEAEIAGEQNQAMLLQKSTTGVMQL